MKTLVYPASFERQSDGSYLILFPDLPGCATEGKDLADALMMAEDCLKTWGLAVLDDGEKLPEATDCQDMKPAENGFVNLVRADLRDSRPVIKSVSLPRWMAEEASKAHLSLSKVLQEALSKRLV